MTSEIRQLWYTRCPAPTPLGIAIQQGRLREEFAREGFDLKALQDSSDPAIRESHFTHSQPYSFRQGGNIPALWARSRGARTRVIGVTWVDEFQGLIALPSSGLTTAADLKGRRLALPRNTGQTIVDFHQATALRGLTSLLPTVALSLSDVSLVNLDKTTPAAGERSQEFTREALALVRGEVDAAFVKGATGLEAANLIGARVLVDTGAQSNRHLHANNGNPRPLTVDAELLEQRPDIVARVLARVIEASEWADSNPADTRAYIARETRSAEHWVSLAYPSNLAQQLRIGLEERDLAALASFKDFLLDTGFIPSDFDVAAWTDPAPLRAAQQLLATRRQTIAA
jgi:ABC-type nitrate/sulfonate/bicarbonate transport system substrate-binding protein